jgi:hypothetical protein
MTEKKNRDETAARKEAEWRALLAARKRIRTWLTSPASKKKAGIPPPARGELGDADLEEIIEKAEDRWRVQSKADPETYAARALGDFRKRERDRGPANAQLAADVAPVDYSAEAQLDASRELRAMRKTAPPAKLTLRAKGRLRLMKPTELAPDRLEDDLGALATRWLLATRQRATDPRTTAVATVLVALINKKCDRELEKVARLGLGQFTGPTSRNVQADAFINAVRTGNSVLVVNTLRISPLIARDTRMPLGKWAKEKRKATISKVQELLDKGLGQPPELVAKAVLRELGCPAVKAKRLDAHRQQAKSRRNRQTEG